MTEFSPPSPDASRSARDLIVQLAEELGVQARVVDTTTESKDTLISMAASHPMQVQTESPLSETDHSVPDGTVRQAVGFSNGEVGIWSCDSQHADRIARHATRVLEHDVLQHENARLIHEVDSLTHQVMNDFEELSLIRSLTTRAELPHTAADVRPFIRDLLMPLAEGVNAYSIGVVLDSETKLERSIVWAGERLVEDEIMFATVERHAEEASRHPVIVNESNVGLVQRSAEHVAPEGIREFLMVQCASKGQVHGWVIACNRRNNGDPNDPTSQAGFSTVQAMLMETATNQLAAQLHIFFLLRQKEELFTDVIRALVNAVEARDPYTCGHSERVASFARLLASKVGFNAADCERIYLTGLLHDVGKIAIPDGVLQKPGFLNDDERAIIETHTDSGWRILHELDALKNVLPGVLYHHERWDGSGYPDGLAESNIPLDGRILAVCDAFDAMTSDRPYRKGMSIEKAISILRDGAGKHWDPEMIQKFVASVEEVDEIRRSHKPREKATRPAPINGVPLIGGSENPAST